MALTKIMPLNEYMALWAPERVPLFSTTDQQLPPCDTERKEEWRPITEPVVWPSGGELIVNYDVSMSPQDFVKWATGTEEAGVTGGEPASDAKPDPDHIWRCIQDAAKAR